MTEEHHQSHGSHESHGHEHHSEHKAAHHGIGHDIPKVDLKGVNVNALKGGLTDVVEILKFNKSRIDAVAGREGEGITMALVYLVIGAIAGPLGAVLLGETAFGVTIRLPIVNGLLRAVVGVAISCIVLYITNLVAERLFQGKGKFPAYFRVMGYASLIGVVSFLTLVPLLSAVAGFWLLGINYVALQQVHKLDSTNAVLTIIVTVVAFFLLCYLALSLGLGGAMMGGGSFAMSYR
jgi:hypothetical protein